MRSSSSSLSHVNRCRQCWSSQPEVWTYLRPLADAGAVRQRHTPRPSAALRNHEVNEARAHGWDTLRNGELLAAAESAGFDVFVATDGNLQFQQNLTGPASHTPRPAWLRKPLIRVDDFDFP